MWLRNFLKFVPRCDRWERTNWNYLHHNWVFLLIQYCHLNCKNKVATTRCEKHTLCNCVVILQFDLWIENRKIIKISYSKPTVVRKSDQCRLSKKVIWHCCRFQKADVSHNQYVDMIIREICSKYESKIKKGKEWPV